MKTNSLNKWVGLAAFLITFAAVQGERAYAMNGTIDFHLTGKLPSSTFGSTIEIEYRTCEDRHARISISEEKGWHPTWGPADISWTEGATCNVSVKVDNFKDGVGYTGVGNCMVYPNSASTCDIPVCKMVSNAAPDCP